ncbi:perilipin-2-like [Microcaecilia unicolor]|uniref:Perilipin n=1 Tax=Microcaecilia unicolor TaxID=1415580 RepID=A0A6P7XIF3_9AMPH|nr:perilipin-2-like [Microcaecilia unicolor]XP_030050059.1 perilipin-2-like [Microcaecilia unicolor]
MALVAAEPLQNVVVRVANLPLVSSTCAMVMSAYTSTKENHPYLKSACEVAEKRMKSITSAALTSAKPIIQKLEPQIALANNYACIGLDKIEEKLPILYQPTDKVFADATDMVVGAKEAVEGTVTGAKAIIANTITGALDKTRGAVQGSMEMTKAAVNDSINTVLGSHIVQMVSTGVDAALTKSEALVDHYLPLTEEEAAKQVTGFEAETQRLSYCVRLGSLSSKIRRRAYKQALSWVKYAKIRSQYAASQLNTTINLHIDSCTLVISQGLVHQLHTTCLTLVSHIQGLPQNIQDQAHTVQSMAGNIYQNIPFRDVSDQLLVHSKGQLKKMKASLDEVMDYLVNNTPLRWLVGSFYPQLLQAEHEKKGDEEGSQ